MTTSDTAHDDAPDLIEHIVRATGLSAAEAEAALSDLVVRGYVQYGTDADGRVFGLRLTMPDDRGSAFSAERQRMAVDRLRASDVLTTGDEDMRVAITVGLLVGETFGEFIEEDVVAGCADVNVLMAARLVLAEADRHPR
jgi:hypothetical protein